MKDLSICIPAYNSSKSIGYLIDSLVKSLSHLNFEVIVVNDASSDNTDEICREWALKDNRIKYYSLRKNVGEYSAVMCALFHAEGEFVAVMDDDGQHLASSLLKMYQKMQHGFDVVFSCYQQSEQSFFRSLVSRIHNSISGKIIGAPRGFYLSTFKVIRKEIVIELLKNKTPYVNLEVAIFNITSCISSLEVEHSKRWHGKSSYTFSKLLNLWFVLVLNSKNLSGLFFLKMGVSIIFTTLICMSVAFWRLGFEDLGLMVLFLFFLGGGIVLVLYSFLFELSVRKNQQSIGTPQWSVKSYEFHK